MEKILTARQFAVMIFISAVAVKMFMLPSLLVAAAGRNGYIFMLGYVAADLAALLPIIYASVKEERDFYSLIESVLGKPVAKIFVGICAVYMLFKTTLMLSEVRVFFSEALFENFNWAVYLIPLLAVVWYASLKPRAVGRTGEILIPFVILSMILLFVLSAGKPQYANLLPVLREKSGGAADYTLWLGDFSALAVFIGRTEKQRSAARKYLTAAGVAAVAVITFTLILSAEYGNIKDLIEYGHNLGGLPQHVGSQNFGRFDLLIFAVWVSAVFVKIIIYVYAFARHTVFALALPEKALCAASAAALAFIYLLSVFVFPTQAAVYGAATGAVLRLVALPEQVGIPLVLIAAAIARRIRKKPAERNTGMKETVKPEEREVCEEQR